MTRDASRGIRRWPAAALLSVALLACGGDQPATEEVAATPAAATAGGADAECMMPMSDVSEILGGPVRRSMRLGSPTSGFFACQYELLDHPGVFVELTSTPAATADTLFAEIRKRARGILGQAAEPERLDVAEGGVAYGSGSYSEAAVVSNGRVYHASMEYMADFGNSIGNRKEHMVALVRRMAQ